MHRARAVDARDAGCPSNAHAISVMRPLSRRCAIVSTPLPVRSRYATGVRVEDAQRVEALGREVDVTVAAARRGRDEEHRLRRDHHAASSGVIAVEALGHGADSLRSADAPTGAAAGWPHRLRRGRGSWSARAGPPRRARSPSASRVRPASRRTRRASTTARPAGAAPIGRRYWPSVTMSTPTAAQVGERGRAPRRRVSPIPRMRPDFVDEPRVLGPGEHRERARRSRPTAAPRAGAGRPSRGCGSSTSGRAVEDRRERRRRRPCSRRSAARPRSRGLAARTACDRRREHRRAAVGEVVARDARDRPRARGRASRPPRRRAAARRRRPASGLRVSTRQKPHARVQRSPRIMNVAVRSAQHS